MHSDQHSVMVFVLNRHGQPLMSCPPRRARHLLRDNKAKVVRRTPFTIQLKVHCLGYKQSLTLGIDTGFKTAGVSVVSPTKEVLNVEVRLRSDAVELIFHEKTLVKIA